MEVYESISEASLFLVAMGCHCCWTLQAVVRLKSGNEISLTLGRLEFQFTGGVFLYLRESLGC